jgi:hypothetical protein
VSKSEALQQQRAGEYLDTISRQINSETFRILEQAKASRDSKTSLRAIERIEKQLVLQAALLSEVSKVKVEEVKEHKHVEFPDAVVNHCLRALMLYEQDDRSFWHEYSKRCDIIYNKMLERGTIIINREEGEEQDEYGDYEGYDWEFWEEYSRRCDEIYEKLKSGEIKYHREEEDEEDPGEDEEE